MNRVILKAAIFAVVFGAMGQVTAWADIVMTVTPSIGPNATNVYASPGYDTNALIGLGATGLTAAPGAGNPTAYSTTASGSSLTTNAVTATDFPSWRASPPQGTAFANQNGNNFYFGLSITGGNFSLSQLGLTVTDSFYGFSSADSVPVGGFAPNPGTFNSNGASDLTGTLNNLQYTGAHDAFVALESDPATPDQQKIYALDSMSVMPATFAPFTVTFTYYLDEFGGGLSNPLNPSASASLTFEQPSVVPEPSSYLLFSLTLLGAGYYGWRAAPEHDSSRRRVKNAKSLPGRASRRQPDVSREVLFPSLFTLADASTLTDPVCSPLLNSHVAEVVRLPGCCRQRKNDGWGSAHVIPMPGSCN